MMRLGLQSRGGLVVVRRPRLRDGRWLSAVLRRRTDPDLREDRRWQGSSYRSALKPGPAQRNPAR